MSPIMLRMGKLSKMFTFEMKIWPDQRRELDALASRTGKKRNAIIRELIDQGIERVGREAMKELFGED